MILLRSFPSEILFSEFGSSTSQKLLQDHKNRAGEEISSNICKPYPEVLNKNPVVKAQMAEWSFSVIHLVRTNSLAKDF